MKNYYTCWGCGKIVEEYDRIDDRVICLECSEAYRSGARSMDAEETEKNYQKAARMQAGMGLRTMSLSESLPRTTSP